MNGIDNTNFIHEDEVPTTVLPTLGSTSTYKNSYSHDGGDLNCSPHPAERDAEKCKTESSKNDLEMSKSLSEPSPGIFHISSSNPLDETPEGSMSSMTSVTVSVSDLDAMDNIEFPISHPVKAKVKEGESESEAPVTQSQSKSQSGETSVAVQVFTSPSHQTIPIPITSNYMTRTGTGIPSSGKPFDSYQNPNPNHSCEMNSQLEFHYNFLFTYEKLRRIWRTSKRYCIVWPSLIFLTWALIYILFGVNESFPGGSLFSLFILEISAIILGELMNWINLPPLIGMLGAGLFLRNVDILGKNIALDLPLSISSPLRAISVVVLLTRGAFSVNPTAIRNFIRVVPQLAAFCCIIEAIVAGTAVYFFIGFPIQWAALQGCIMSAMSGVAVMPFLLSFENSCKLDVGSASSKAIAIAKTACGLDAILAICMAEFCLGFIFGDGKLVDGLMKGVVEVLMGGAFGLTWGFLAGFCLNDKNSAEVRTFSVFGGGILGLLGLTKIGYPRGGPLAVFAGSLVTSIIWRKKNVGGVNNDKINQHFTQLWFIFQPLLFGIIGSRTDLLTVDWTILSNAILCLAFSLSARILTAITMSSCVSLTLREKLFLAVAWIPKGTVQAALGPVALDTVKDTNFGPEAEKLGYQVMTIAVLTIILGSSLGSFFLILFGPRLLRPKYNNDNHISDSIRKKPND